ncbi:hypothetical protein ACQX22_09170 [Corynebacterium diphtheriae]
MAWLGLAGIGGHWWALVSAPPPLTPEKTALHTKSAQTAGLDVYRGLNILHIFNAIYAGSCTFHSFTIGATLEL